MEKRWRMECVKSVKRTLIQRWVLAAFGALVLVGLVFNVVPSVGRGDLSSTDVAVLGRFSDASTKESLTVQDVEREPKEENVEEKKNEDQLVDQHVQDVETTPVEEEEEEKVEDPSEEEHIEQHPKSEERNDDKQQQQEKQQAKELKWSQPRGQGVDLEKLNQCLEKHVRAYFFHEDTARDDGVPLASRHWIDNGGELWGGEGFGSGTTWTISKSKQLAYLILPKVGSMTFRAELGYCDERKGIPCDVLNVVGRPWQPEDARMNFLRGFYHTFQNKTSKEYEFTTEKKEDFVHAMLNSLPFTFVTDPITKFIGAYIQVHLYKESRSENYVSNFVRRAIAYTKLVRNSTRNKNPHFAPQLYYLVNAAVERSLMERKDDNHKRDFVAPFEFVGRLDRATGQQDWRTLRDMLGEKYPGKERFVMRKLISSNGSRLYTDQEKEEIRKRAVEENYATWVRQMTWAESHYKGKKALGHLAHASTWPKELAQRFCAAFYTEYICLGLDFPAQCKDRDGNLDVGRFPLHLA